MRKFFKYLLAIVLFIPLAIVATVFFLAFSSQPLLTPSAESIQQSAFTTILRKQQRDLRFGNPVINVSDADLNILINYSLQQSRYRDRIAMDIRLDNQNGQVIFTSDTGLPLKPFINIQVLFHFDDRQPVLDRTRIGLLPIPQTMATSLMNVFAQQLFQSRAGATWQRFFDAIQSIAINNHQITLRYGIDNTNIPSLIDAQGNNVIAFYQKMLLDTFPAGGKIPLNEAMQTLFKLAKKRTDSGADAVTENTAAIVTLGLQVAPQNLLDLFGITERYQRTYAFSIERQRDLGKHFLNSALLTIYGGRQLANLAGIYKELVDMQLRQDFNIRDLAANQAGIRFAFIAINPQFATDVQKLMAENNDPYFFFPSTKNLDSDLQNRLEDVANHQQGDLQRTVRNRVGEFIEQAPLYKILNRPTPSR